MPSFQIHLIEYDLNYLALGRLADLPKNQRIQPKDLIPLYMQAFSYSLMKNINLQKNE